MTTAGMRALLVGVGGLGCASAWALVRSGITALGLCDDDVVERSNLHRQILFDDADVGQPKVEAAARALKVRAAGLDLSLHPHRFLPENAVDLVGKYDIVLEGSDNFATKFLAADACKIAAIPVVHASAVRWIGTALAVGAEGRPCYRCLFEDLPPGDAPNCADAGVMGPVVGVVAAAQVDLALSLFAGASVSGEIVTFDGRDGALRRRQLRPRAECALCDQPSRIRGIDPAAYASPAYTG